MFGQSDARQRKSHQSETDQLIDITSGMLVRACQPAAAKVAYVKQGRLPAVLALPLYLPARAGVHQG
jgi:hypothetical protein